MWEIKSCKKDDQCYPESLRQLASAPEILYYVGDISICNNMVIAMIGKREAQERHLSVAWAYAEALAKRGYTVLNGLAVGCDTHALEGAVAANGKVVAVMPGGLDAVYPKSNQKLAEKIVANGGCLVSEYPNGTKPQKYTFVQRDKIQAMLSNKVFVIASEKEGGTMHTVEYAYKLAKPLGCFVEKGTQTMPGNQMLVDKNMATAICDTEDLMLFVEQPEYKQMSLF